MDDNIENNNNTACVFIELPVEIWEKIISFLDDPVTKANYRYNYILGNDHSFFYFNYPDLSPVYDI